MIFLYVVDNSEHNLAIQDTCAGNTIYDWLQHPKWPHNSLAVLALASTWVPHSTLSRWFKAASLRLQWRKQDTAMSQPFLVLAAGRRLNLKLRDYANYASRRRQVPFILFYTPCAALRYQKQAVYIPRKSSSRLNTLI